MVQLVYLKGEKVPLTLFLFFVLSLFHSIITMTLAYWERPAIRRPILSLTLDPVSPAITPVLPQNDLFRQFIKAYMENRRNLALLKPREPPRVALAQNHASKPGLRIRILQRKRFPMRSHHNPQEKRQALIKLTFRSFVWYGIGTKVA